MAPKRRPSALRAVLTRQRARAARGCAGMPRATGRTAPTPGIELELELEGVERHRDFAVGPACLSGDPAPSRLYCPTTQTCHPLLPYGAGGPGVCLGALSCSRLTPVHVPRPPVLAEARDRTIPTG